MLTDASSKWMYNRAATLTASSISRRRTLKSARTILSLVLFGCLPVLAQERDPAPLLWFKGNTHTHTINSDGDSAPDDVVKWYRENGYNFLVLSDHNYCTRVDGLTAVHGADGKFILIPGEEISDWFERKPIHINGLNLSRVVEPQGGVSPEDVVQRNVTAIRSASGIPHINHPNFEWSLTVKDLLKIEGDRLLEIFNGHPHVNNLGGGGSPSLEEMWDAVLTAGKPIWGIAVDDAHHFKRQWDREAARPGRGWVMVRAARLETASILDALERGDFYASTGVELADYRADDTAITVTVRPAPSSRYRVQFIGERGQLLQESLESTAAYRFRGDERYVRAKVIESNGTVAWTQPVFRQR